MNPEIDLLLARYFAGEASEKDLEQLDYWLSQSADNETYFDEMTLLYQQSRPATTTRKPNTDAALAKFLAHINSTTEEEKIPESKPAEQTTSRKTRNLRIYWQVAAAVAVLIVGSIFVYRITNNNIPSEERVILLAETSEEQHTLADSTKIILAANSTISYSENFGDDNRNIDLNGKATFEVVTHTDKKLIITAGETFIEDIGTVFTVDARPDDDEITVYVESGKVLFYTSTNKGIEIGAGESGVFYKTNKQFELVDDEDEEQTSEGSTITFNATPLKDALTQLSTQYNVNLQLADPQLGNLLISVSFYDEDIELVLEIIAETLGLTVQKKNGAYVLAAQN